MRYPIFTYLGFLYFAFTPATLNILHEIFLVTIYNINYNIIFVLQVKRKNKYLSIQPKWKKNHFKHMGTQSNKASTISSMPSDKLRLLEQEILLPTGPQSSSSLPELDISVDLYSKASTISASKSQVERMSVTSVEIPSLFSGLSDIVEAAKKEGIFYSEFSTTSTSKSQVVRYCNLIILVSLVYTLSLKQSNYQ